MLRIRQFRLLQTQFLATKVGGTLAAQKTVQTSGSIKIDVLDEFDQVEATLVDFNNIVFEGNSDNIHTLDMASYEGVVQIDAGLGNDTVILEVNDLDAQQVVTVGTINNGFGLNDDTNDFTGLSFESLVINQDASSALVVELLTSIANTSLTSISVNNAGSSESILSLRDTPESSTFDLVNGFVANDLSEVIISTSGFNAYYGTLLDDTYILSADKNRHYRLWW